MIVYNEDCRTTLNRPNLSYNYIICSPPDFIHLKLAASDSIGYLNFISSVFSLVNSTNGCYTIILTDRKDQGKIFTKHSIVESFFRSNGFDLISQKIWIKTLGVMKHRLTYAICLTFSKGLFLQNNTHDFKPDVFQFESEIIDDYKDNFPINLIQLFIEEYTQVGNTIYDPFIGSGTTAIAALMTNRYCIGSEIDEAIANICNSRLLNYKNI